MNDMVETEGEFYQRIWTECKKRKSEDKNNKACEKCKSRELKFGDEVPENCPTLDTVKDTIKYMKKSTEDMGKGFANWIKYEAERGAQPFKTNYLLDKILKSETPNWVNCATLIVAILSFIIGLWALLHTYGII